MGLKETEAECAVGRTAPRVSLADIEAAIADRFFLDGANFLRASLAVNGVVDELSREQHIMRVPPVGHLTVCLVVLRNGFAVIGRSAPAHAANYDGELGRKLAYEDAVRQIWPMMGYALRDRLWQESGAATA